MDDIVKKTIKAIATAYGNYRAAILEADIGGTRIAYSHVVATGTALLDLQRLIDVEVAHEGRVQEAIDYAREQVEGNDWEVR